MEVWKYEVCDRLHKKKPTKSIENTIVKSLKVSSLKHQVILCK